MLLPWLDLPGARDRLGAWSALTGLDLVALGSTGTDDDLRDTAVAQPLLTAAALLSAEALLHGATPDVVCGHSVGELPALALAGVLTPEQAIWLAAERGATMAAAATTRSTGMAAVLGGRPDEVTAEVERLGLTVATVNVDGQVVVGGATEALDALAATPPTGARVRRLEVAGAFHTAAMQPAVTAFRGLVDEVEAEQPRCVVVANADGAVVDDGRGALDRLVTQLTGPVRFDLCLRKLAELGATAVVELAPGGTLAALARRALPAVPVVALRSPEDLPAASELLSQPVPS
jgi:[acyl-carrier-protein] S-malonyltransferase